MREVYTTKAFAVMVYWQEPKADDAIGEPAIAMKVYSDVLELRQGRAVIMIEKSCVPEFVKAVKEIVDLERKE